jgi:steroid delta-isomerase-like uncharacterized protein
MTQTTAVTVMCVAMMLLGAPVRAVDAQNRCTRIAHNWVKFWNQDKDILASDVFTEDIMYQDVPLGVVVDGAKAFQAFAQSVFTTFPQSTFTLVKSSCRGQQGFIEWRWSAMDDPGFFRTMNQIDVQGVAIIEIHGNRIARNTDYWDYATVLRQLDQLPPGL